MITRKSAPWQAPEDAVTPEPLFLNRRRIIKAGGLAGLGFLAGCGPTDSEAQQASAAANAAPVAQPGADLQFTRSAYTVADAQTPYEAVTSYNNYYEFGTGKDDPARNAHTLVTDPWSITVEGHANRTGAFALDEVVDFGALEERIYRLRCVEAWSMVIPWVGVPMASVLAKFEPTAQAKYVQFETYLNRQQMPGVRFPVLDWPYVEGLRMDEAMNELAFVAVGLYGKTLPKQNGAPVRIVAPWKYGFKSAKSITRIRFVENQPKTSWNQANAREYGFYSNVNPQVAHPRWSQATERVIGGSGLSALIARRDTEMFNGYEAEVASLYAGMDLRRNY